MKLGPSLGWGLAAVAVHAVVFLWPGGDAPALVDKPLVWQIRTLTSEPVPSPAVPQPSQENAIPSEPAMVPDLKAEPSAPGAVLIDEVEAAPAPPGSPTAAEPAPISAEVYQTMVRNAVAEKLIYPSGARSRRQEGTAVVRFQVGSDGALKEPPVLVRSSSYPRLDEAALITVVSAAPFSPPPSGQQLWEFTVPLEFVLRP